MKTKSKEEKFIQIGIKKDGKVIKSEEYNIGDFFGNIYAIPKIRVPNVKITLFEMIFARKTVNQYITDLYESIAKMNRHTQEAMMTRAIQIINCKEFGKKSKITGNRWEEFDKKGI